MKWRNDVYSEVVLLEPRWVRWWRQLKRLTVVAFLLALLAFLGLHPMGQALIVKGKTVGQAAWQWAAAQGEHYLGPEPLLRRRAQWAIAGLATEQEQLQRLRVAATQAMTDIEQQLPLRQEAEQLAVETMRRGAVPLSTPQSAALPLASWGAPLLAYSDLQEQVAYLRQAHRIHAATLVQAQALQQEAQAQQEALENTLTFFAQRQQIGEPGEVLLSAGEQAALRSALQRQIAQAHAISAARRALEATVQALTPPPSPATPADKPSLAQLE